MPVTAGGQTITYIEIILDCSDTMKREVGKAKKLDVAKSALVDFINEAPPEYRFALRIMGGEESATYYTSELLAPMGHMSKFSLIEMVQELEPAGERALYNALSEATYDFTDDEGNNILIVITDGVDDGGQSLANLEDYYASFPGAPRVYFYGLDITKDMEQEFNGLIRSAGGAVYNLKEPSELKILLKKAFSELAANLSVFLYDEKGVPVNGKIIVYNSAGEPLHAAYDASSLIKELPDGIYDVEATYKGETKRETFVDIRPGGGNVVKIIFAQRAGNIRITLIDSLASPIRGYVKVRDIYYQNVYEGGPDNTFLIGLPEGTFEIVATAGGRSYTQSGVMVMEGAIQDIEIIIPVVQAVLEVEVNNMQSIPINAHVQVYTLDGFLMGEAEYVSYYHVTVPPDMYSVSVEVGDKRYEKTINLYDGDQQTLNFDVDVEVGYLLIELRTESGRDAWGIVKVYDTRGEYRRHWSVELEESPDWSLELPEGTYRVEGEVEGIVSARDGVIIEGGQETRVTLKFPDYVG
jgi:hypothetical protein